MSRIVEQLFTLTQLDNGESRAGWTRFDLADLARTTADQLSLLAEDKKIALTCAAGPPAWVQGDRSRVKQVIVNLLDNAIKYTPADGRVQLRVGGVNGHAVLEVEDTGIGIPPEALPHVFERFYPRGPGAFRGSAERGPGVVHRQIHLRGARRGSAGGQHAQGGQLFYREISGGQSLIQFP